MKDLVRLAVYGFGTLGVILALIFGAQVDAISSDAIGIFAILAVIVVPVIIIIIMSKREKRAQDEV